jgi:7-keto-8-aminopelargonate synthetase-like enzyme
MTEPEPLQLIGVNEVRFRGRQFTYYSGCDFLRLARDPRLAAAASKTLVQHGLTVAASRITTGNHQLYTQLETALATFFDAPTALLLPDGYLAPMAVAQALAGEFTHAFIDELAHGALADAARMLDCPVQKFPHRDAAALAKLISQAGRTARPIVLTDGIFSHIGSAAPLRDYLKILPARGLILVDDAYGAGLVGAHGRGTLELCGVSRSRIIQCATLSKAFGAYGGIVLGSRVLREKMRTRSRNFMGTTPLPLPLAGAAFVGLKIVQREPARRQRLFANLKWMRTQLRAAGWAIDETPGPILRLPLLPAVAATKLKARLLTAGIYPPFLKYGNTAQGYFRFIISSKHTKAQLARLRAELVEFKNTPATKERMTKAAWRKLIRSFRGKYKAKPGQKPFAERMAEYKAEENALEEAKWQRCFSKR